MNKKINLDEDIKILASVLLERVAELKSKGVLVQSQPLGFMRLALDGQKNANEGLFLHVWIPGLPTQEGGPFMHTHVFDLKSRILLGSIKDTVYTPKSDSNGTYRLIRTRCAQDYCAPFTDVQDKVTMEVTEVKNMLAGNVYRVAKGDFHTTSIIGNGTAMTLMQKANVDDEDPILAIPVDTAIPEDIFRRDQIEQEFAWQKIRELLQDCLL